MGPPLYPTLYRDVSAHMKMIEAMARKLRDFQDEYKRYAESIMVKEKNGYRVGMDLAKDPDKAFLRDPKVDDPEDNTFQP